MKELKWKYRIHIKPYTNKILAMLAWAMGFMIIWCEATIGLAYRTGVNYSPFGMLLQWSDSLILDYFVSLCVLAYMSFAVNRSMFRISLPGIRMYTLHTGKQSDVCKYNSETSSIVHINIYDLFFYIYRCIML